MDAIQFIGAWFKQIILVVLLAVFLEFLLPTQTMQKYARLVMGMVLVSVMLIPIGKILHLDMNTIEQQVLQFLQQSPSSESLTNIYQNANKIKQVEQSEAIDTWKQQVETGLKQQIQQQFAVQVLSLDLDMSDQKDQTVPLIRSVQIDVKQSSASDGQKASGQESPQVVQGIQITPVQPVQTVDHSDAETVPTEGNIDRKPETFSKSEQSLQQQIVTYIQQQFHLSMDSIHITFEDAARG